MLGPTDEGTEGLFLFLCQIKRATAINKTATPPIAIPAMGPAPRALSPSFGGADGDGEGGASVGTWSLGIPVVIVVGVKLEGCCVFESPDVPSAVRFKYAGQSAAGAASGQVGCWQRDRSWGLDCGLKATAGAQRTLYLEFRDWLMVFASCSEKPKCSADMVS